MENIEQLNQRFGDALGRPDGLRPRFQWMWKRGILMDTQKWFICQLIENPFTQEQWTAIHGNSKPYPGKLRWVEHTETALPLGVLPTGEHTARYIRTLGEQMDAAEKALKDAAAGRMTDEDVKAEADAQASQNAGNTEFEEKIAEWEPLSWKLGEPHEPGDHDGPVAFQVGGSRDEPVASA